MKKYLKKYKYIISLFFKIVEISVFIVAVLALKSDIETRNSEYRPLIKVEFMDEAIDIGWNENIVNGSIQIKNHTLTLTNIGKGIADNVVVEFDSSVLDEWIKILRDLNPKGDYDYLSSYDKDEMTTTFSYMLNDVSKSYTVTIPQKYFECLAEIENFKNISDIGLPSIRINICCDDIQQNPISYTYESDTKLEENGIMACTNNTRYKRYILKLDFKKIKYKGHWIKMKDICSIIEIILVTIGVLVIVFILATIVIFIFKYNICKICGKISDIWKSWN